MYFELVLAYPATFVNDISLMNFSNRLAGLLYMLQLLSFPFPLVLYPPGFCSGIPSFQSCLSLNKLRLLNSPFVWDCKGRNLFVIVKLFCFYFFKAFKPQKPVCSTSTAIFQNLFTLSFSLFPFLRSGLQK